MMHELKETLSHRGLASIGGLGCSLAWIYAPFLSDDLFYIFFHSGFALALASVAALYRVRPSFVAPSAMQWTAASLMSISALSVWAVGASNPALHSICAVLGGIGSAWLFAHWFLPYSRRSIKRAVNQTLLAVAFSSCIRFALVIVYSLFPAIAFSLLMVIPFASAATLVRHPESRTSWSKPEGNGTGAVRTGTAGKPFWGSFTVVVVELVAYGLVFGILRNGINEWSTSTPSMVLGHFLRIILPLMLLWWLAVRTRNEPHDGLLRGSLLIIVFALLAGIFFGGAGPMLLSAIVLVARSFVTILIYVRLFDIVSRSNLHPCAIYGVGRGVYEFSLVTGLFVYDWVVVRNALASLSPNVAYFAVACIVMLLLSSFTATLRLSSLKEAPEHSGSVGQSTVEDLCLKAVKQFGLSEREAQVLPLIVKGHTKKYIADVLGLSEDTIRYHTKQLYRKLNVHSRQELLLCIGID